MTAELTPKTVSIDGFIASKQIKLFQGLKQDRFSGQIVFRDYQATEWSFFLYLGRILYVTGGTHPVRRWRRSLASYFPQMAAQLQKELSSLKEITATKVPISWDYYLLCLWAQSQKIDREQATKMIRAITTEVLFDITQAKDINYYLKPEQESIEEKLAMIDSEQQIIEAWKLWQEWEKTRIAKFSPNLAPTIKQPEVLKQKTSEKTYQAFSRLLNGKHSLRDIAVRKQTSTLLTARSIIPYIQLGFIQLIDIPDLPQPITINISEVTKQSSSANQNELEVTNEARDNVILKPSQPTSSTFTKPTIACVENSFIICQIMKKIITSAGYNYISQSDALQAIAVILDVKPDLIFINIELAELSGYDLCTELRQLPYFKDTPIILFSKNINLVDRVKAKMAGCSELLNQSLEAKSVLDTIRKYCDRSSNLQ